MYSPMVMKIVAPQREGINAVRTDEYKGNIVVVLELLARLDR